MINYQNFFNNIILGPKLKKLKKKHEIIFNKYFKTLINKNNLFKISGS